MNTYPKHILSLEDQVQTYIDGGMTISDVESVKKTLTEIGYYRLRGYSFHLYDKATKKYKTGTSFNDVLNLYNFDAEISSLVLAFTSKIEIALRVRFCEAMLTTKDSMAYLDASHANEKSIFWKNISSISSEIHRSKDVFIEHNYKNHDGLVPMWAAVEIMSFGTLSKYIKNLNSSQPIYKNLASHYTYVSSKGNVVIPSMDKLTSWIHSVVVLRNICAHNARIFNRTFATKPTVLDKDMLVSPSRYCGLYELMLAMKYIRPSDDSWNSFVSKFKLVMHTHGITDVQLYFPSDWESHMVV